MLIKKKRQKRRPFFFTEFLVLERSVVMLMSRTCYQPFANEANQRSRCKSGKTAAYTYQRNHWRMGWCMQTLRHPYLIRNSKIKKVLQLKPFIRFNIRFHRYTSRDEIFKSRSHVDMFRTTFFGPKSYPSLTLKLPSCNTRVTHILKN